MGKSIDHLATSASVMGKSACSITSVIFTFNITDESSTKQAELRYPAGADQLYPPVNRSFTGSENSASARALDAGRR